MNVSKALVATLSATLALANLGCGASEKYEHGDACGVNNEIVTALVGSDVFAVRSAGPDLPLRNGDSNKFSCEVSVRDDAAPVLDVTARLTSTRELSGFRLNAESADQTFEVVGGAAGVTTKSDSGGDDTVLGYEGWWACAIDSPSGTPVIYLTGETRSGTVSDVKGLLAALADRAGCRASTR